MEQTDEMRWLYQSYYYYIRILHVQIPDCPIVLLYRSSHTLLLAWLKLQKMRRGQIGTASNPGDIRLFSSANGLDTSPGFGSEQGLANNISVQYCDGKRSHVRHPHLQGFPEDASSSYSVLNRGTRRKMFVLHLGHYSVVVSS